MPIFLFILLNYIINIVIVINFYIYHKYFYMLFEFIKIINVTFTFYLEIPNVSVSE